MSKPIDRRDRGIDGDVSANKTSYRKRNNSPQFIQSLKNGDASAYNELVTSETKHLIDFVTPTVGSVEDAEEVVQDVFLSLWQKRETIEFTTSLYGYIYNAAKYKAFRFLWQKKRRVQFIYDESAYMTSDFADSPEDIAQSNQMEVFIEEITDKMPVMMQRIYRMKQEEGLSTNEIAGILSTHPANVRKQLSRALKRIKEALESIG